MTLPPLSLYVHIPWCVRKCPYCDFNSHAAAGELPEQAYIDCLRADMACYLPATQGRKLSSIFFGGGTPSLFSAAGIKQILHAANSTLGFAPDIEVTLEANPGTFEQGRFADYRRAGVNRLSIGVQSFHSAHLQILGRIHSESDATVAVRRARDVGFDNINIDLMHGLPNQTPAQALTDLERALELNPSHISWYQLTIEKNTRFYTQPPPLPSADTLAEIEDQGMALLANAGYHRYEVSAFCRDDLMCQHNLNYWQFGDYLGIGAGAHGKITDPDSEAIKRSHITRLPQHYLSQRRPDLHWQNVEQGQLPFEFMMNALRLVDGVPADYFPQRTGLEMAVIEKTLQGLKNKGLLTTDNRRLQCSPSGYRFLNDVVGEFL